MAAIRLCGITDLAFAGRSRYLFESHALYLVEAARNKGGTTEAQAFRPLRAEGFFCLNLAGLQGMTGA